MRDYYSRVKNILETNEQARDDDFILWLAMIDEEDLFFADSNTFREGLIKVKEKSRDLPKFESVRRNRQRVQQDCCDLRGSRREERMKEAKLYHDKYSRR